MRVGAWWGVGVSGPLRLSSLALLLAQISCDLFGGNSGPVQISWSYPLSGSEAGWIGIPALSGSLAIAQNGPWLRAFDMTSGHVAWSTRLTSGSQIGGENVAAAAGRAFIAGADSVFAIDASTGQRLWAFLPDAQGALCEIAADAKAVYVGTRSHRVYALSADSGHVLWSIDIGPAWTNPGFVTGLTTAADTVYVNALKYLNPSGGFSTAQVLALTQDSGRELWRYTGTDSVNGTSGAPRAVGDLLLVSDLYGHRFFALNRFSGAEVWRDATGGLGPIQAPVASGTTLYVGGEDNFAYSVDLPTGVTRWKVDVGGSIDYVALCGRVLLANNLQLKVLDTARGTDLQTILSGEGEDYPTSGIVSLGTNAFVIGNAGAYGLSCPH